MKDRTAMEQQVYGMSNALATPVKLTLTEQLTMERQRLVQRMAEIDELLTAMRENPGVERLIDMIFRQGLR